MSLSPFPRDNLAMMAKVVAAGREQQGDMVAEKNGETFPGIVVLLSCCWSVNLSLPHHMHQEAEGKCAQWGCKTTLHCRVKTRRIWAWDRLSMGMVAVGAMAGAVLYPGLLWVWANLGHKHPLALLWVFLLELLSPWLHPSVRNFPDVMARSLIPPASSD